MALPQLRAPHPEAELVLPAGGPAPEREPRGVAEANLKVEPWILPGRWLIGMLREADG